jgi:hypothetical protein
MKKALKIVGILIAVLVVLLAVAWFKIDYIAKSAIESGGTSALGVKTSTDAAIISLLKGEVGVNGLTVSNPEGYKTPHFIKTGKLDVGVDLGTLIKDMIVVNRFELDDVDVNLEHGVGVGITNVQAILKNIQGPDTAQKEPAKEGGKKIKVGRITIRHITAHVQLLPIGGTASMLNVEIPELVLDDVSSDNAGGVVVPELIKRLVPAILAAIFEKGKGAITDPDFSKLGDQLADVAKSLGPGAAKLTQQAGDVTKQATEKMGKAFEGAGEPLKKGTEGLFKGTGNLFGSKTK